MRPSEGDILADSSRLAARDQLLAQAHAGGKEMDPPRDLTAAVLDAARVLNASRVPYALVGGLAVAIHTRYPRAAPDIDLAVRSDADLARLLDALGRGKFTRGRRFEHTILLRHENGQVVKLVFHATFDPAIDRAETFRVGRAKVRLVTREDLIAMKEGAAADPTRRRSKALRDRADVEMLRGDVPGLEEGW